jgi:hypothetical protein
MLLLAVAVSQTALVSDDFTNFEEYWGLANFRVFLHLNFTDLFSKSVNITISEEVHGRKVVVTTLCHVCSICQILPL